MALADQAGELATVSLTVDTSPWEKALDKANAATKAWGAKTTHIFEGVGVAFDERGEMFVTEMSKAGSKLQAKLEKEDHQHFKWQQRKMEEVRRNAEARAQRLATLMSGVMGNDPKQAIGGVAGVGLGSIAGGAVGSVFGPAGTAIGSAFGGAIGGVIVPAILDKIDLSPVEDAFSGIGFAVKARFGEMEATWSSVGGKLGDIAAQVAARVTGLFDTAWERAKGPIAGVADLIQQAFQRIGLASEGTAKWGDSIRSLKDAGTEAFAKLAYGLGYLNDLFATMGGYIDKYFTAPLLAGVSQALKGMQELAAAGKRLPDTLGGGVGGVFDQIGEAVGGAADRMGKVAAAVTKSAQERIDRRTGATGEQWERRARDLLARGRALNAVDDLARVPPSVERATAAVRGSREAVQAVISATARGGANAPQERAAKAAEDTAQLAREQLAVSKEIRDGLRNPPVVESA